MLGHAHRPASSGEGCDEILLSQRVHAALQEMGQALAWSIEPAGELELKGFARKVPAWRAGPLDDTPP